MTDSRKVGHGGVLTGEDQLFGEELDAHALGGQLTHDAAEVVEVAGEAVHGVHDHGVPVADEAEQGHPLRPVGVFARRALSERAVDGDALELPVGVLVEAADSSVGDPLSGDRMLPPPIVSGWNLRPGERGVNQ